MSLIELSKSRMSNYTGATGEFLVASEFSKLGYEVFFPIGGKTSCDFVAYNNIDLLRIEVKTVSYREKPHSGSYKVSHGSMSPHKYDILATYIIPLDTVCYFSSVEIVEKGSFMKVRSREEAMEYGVFLNRSNFVEDYVSLQRAIKSHKEKKCLFNA